MYFYQCVKVTDPGAVQIFKYRWLGGGGEMGGIVYCISISV